RRQRQTAIAGNERTGQRACETRPRSRRRHSVGRHDQPPLPRRPPDADAVSGEGEIGQRRRKDAGMFKQIPRTVTWKILAVLSISALLSCERDSSRDIPVKETHEFDHAISARNPAFLDSVLKVGMNESEVKSALQVTNESLIFSNSHGEVACYSGKRIPGK